MSNNEINLKKGFYEILRVFGIILWIIGILLILFSISTLLLSNNNAGSTSLLSLGIMPILLILGFLFVITGSLSIIAGK